MQDGGDGLQEVRAEGFYAHGIKSIPSLSTIPPIVPPKPMQEVSAIPAKSTATAHHRRQGRGKHARQGNTAAPAPDSRPQSISQPAPAARRPPAPAHRQTDQQRGQRATKQRACARYQTIAPAPANQTAPTCANQDAPARVGTPGGILKVCGCGGAKYF